MRTFLILTTALTLTTGAYAQNTTATGTAQASAQANATIQTAVLLDARGRVVGEFNRAGQLVARGAVNTATQVQVTTQSGLRSVYALDGQLRSGAQLTLDTVMVSTGQARASVSAAAQASVTAMQNARLLAGRTVTFTNASGQAVARVAANGTLTVMGDLRSATTATIEGGASVAQRLQLDSALSATAAGALNLGTVTVEQGRGALSLTSVLTGAVQLGGNASGNGSTGGTTSGEATGGASGNVSGNAGLNIGVGGNAGGSASGGTGISIGVGTGGGIGIGIGTGGK
ncbi:hypothetical protein Deima_0906 [Deinococcus maricopensis DSM 21211]|uniref:Uncharacterized protein n=2 Tax=Deinococcus TaxID=1298 RepID=E8U671_DEIML|nr:hypothetical protein Deima_0906 [Deinococcus maricopensis DSM 21211]